MIDDTIKKDVEEKIEEPVITEPIISEPKKIEPEVEEPEIIDIDLGFVEKKKFRISGDYNRMLELNVSDLNIATRLKEGYPKLKNLMAEVQQRMGKISDDLDDEELLDKLSNDLSEIDRKMREIIDYIFDTNASEICAPSGNMFDPVGGQWRFERIIDKLTQLYTNGLYAEFNKIKANVEKKTSKYTKKK